MEFVWFVFELVRSLSHKWFEGNVDRARRNQARAHSARGREFLREGRFRQAKIEFNCASYYRPDNRALLSTVGHALSIRLQQAHRRHRREGIYRAAEGAKA